MRIYKTQDEVEKDIKNGMLIIEGDVRFECSIKIEASIKIVAGNIDALNINAFNIDALNIDALNINALNINALNINALNINAFNIDAEDIDAGDILYYAVCFAYKNIKCLSIRAKRKVAKHFCLDGEIIFKEKSEPKEKIVKIKLKDGQTVEGTICED